MRFMHLFIALTVTTLLTGCLNFHSVKKGELYRSAQLNDKQLDRAIRKLGIKTVINLRGKSDRNWYLDEKNVAERHGVKLVSIQMSAKRLPTRADLIKLLDTFRDAERPILIHCKGGADRTGEAAAIFAMEYMGQSKKKALHQLSPKYFHFPKFKPAKRYFIKNIWQGAEWAYQNYDPCKSDYKYFNKAIFCDENGNELPRPQSDFVESSVEEPEEAISE